jgi:hypothetical protein
LDVKNALTGAGGMGCEDSDDPDDIEEPLLNVAP